VTEAGVAIRLLGPVKIGAARHAPGERAHVDAALARALVAEGLAEQEEEGEAPVADPEETQGDAGGPRPTASPA
jgi:hypothetical protein